MFQQSLLTVLLATAAMQAAESMASRPNAEIEPTQVGREIAIFNVRGGQVVLVEQLGGTVGFAAIGGEAMGVVQTLVGEYDLSGLEMYEVLGGNPMNAPSALVRDHEAHYADHPSVPTGRRLPSLESIIVTPMALNTSKKGLLGGSACSSSWQSPYESFTYWFFDLSGMYSGVGALGDLGANGISDAGIWNKGDLNVNLGSTSAGAVCVCFPVGYPSYPSARIRVEERSINGAWIQLWSSNLLLGGAGYGYWFKGASIRRIRLLVRDNEAHSGLDFFWAGSY